MNAYIIPGLIERSKRLKRVIHAEEITNSILKYFNADFDEVKKKGRKREIVLIRFIICYCLREHTKMGLKEIANYLSPAIGDHTTVIHAVRFIDGQLTSKFDNNVKDIFNEIYF